MSIEWLYASLARRTLNEKRSFLGKGVVVNFIQSWKESVRLFERQNLKSFLMVTAKTFLDVYGAINRPFTGWGNWISLGIIVTLVLLTNVIKMLHLFWVEAIILNSMLHFFFFIFCLAMRPSTDIKDMAYFRSYIERFWLLLVVAILLGISRVYVVPFVFIWYIFSLLFAFDSGSSLNDLLRSFQNGFVMVLYNLPVCVALWAVLAVLNVVLYYFIGFALGYFGGLTMAAILYIFFVPIEVALITNLYIKFLHGQSSLYFPQPKQ